MAVALIIVGTVVLVAVIALVAIGREAFTLGFQPKQTVFDLEEAVDFVADRLPDSVTAQISYDDVRDVLRWFLDYLRDRGVPIRRDLTAGGPVVVEDDEAVAFLLLKADEHGLAITDEQIASVLEAALLYIGAIGAVGGEVADPLQLEAETDQRPELPPP